MIPQEILEKEFATHKQALQLKELGFNEVCISVYSEKGELSPLQNMEVRNSNVPSYCTAPLRQQVFRWFRNNGFAINIYSSGNDNKDWYYLIKKGTIDTNDIVYNNYEEAELDCLNKLIQILKEQTKS